jgi:hypothetical protein
VTEDGTALLLGGAERPGEATKSVESYAWEPALRLSLDEGFYIATANQRPNAVDGFWGLEVHSSGALDGGLNFGGLLAAKGSEVGFGAFYIAEPQTVTANLNLQALPGNTGPLEVTLRVLDVNKNVVAGPINGIGNLTWNRALQPGFYVLELRSSDRAPPMSFQMAVSAPQLQAGGSAGCRVEKSAGVTGFVAFYLATKQDVAINLYNENTYGRPRGAGEITLTLMDATGKVVQQNGPGALGGSGAEAQPPPLPRIELGKGRHWSSPVRSHSTDGDGGAPVNLVTPFTGAAECTPTGLSLTVTARLGSFREVR